MTNRKKATRIIGKEYCTLEVELRVHEDSFKVLSICGTAGRVATPAAAAKEALAYWETFFEDQPEERRAMNERCGKNFRTAKSAAKFVVDSDGEYHGLDVAMEHAGKVFISHSCGQIREELKRFFPEVEPYFKHHLNDMHAGCEHQETLGWGRGHDVALSKNDLTPAQRAELERQAEATAEKVRAKEFEKRLSLLRTDEHYQHFVLKAMLKRSSLSKSDVEDLRRALGPEPLGAAFALKKKVEAYLRNEVTEAYPAASVESKVYKDSISAPCPTCGYCYGTQWLRRELPAEVIAWFDALPDNDVSEYDKAGKRKATFNLAYTPVNRC